MMPVAFYLITANMFASVILEYIMEFAEDIYHDDILYEKARDLKQDIDYGIECFGIVNHPEFGRIYAYETDGYGNYMLMDDANVPSLLSIHYLGFKDQNDPVYQNTRRFILSKNNPYFYQGTAAAGIGSPHTPENHIWYIALSMQGLTGTETEAKGMIKMILKTDNNENVTQESFHKNDPGQISCLQNLFTKHTCRNKQK